MRAAALVLALLAAGCDDDDFRPVDAAGVDHDLGIPQDALPTVSGPMKLSETGLYSDFAARTLAPDVIAFEPRYPLWSDGADKQRYLLLPPGGVIDTGEIDHWVFPIGTKAWKEFRKDGKLVETRLLQKVEEGGAGWWMMAYLWNDTDTEADAVVAGRDDARGTTHKVPSQEDCFGCHLLVRDTLIGVSAFQLAGGADPSPLARLTFAGRLSAPPASEPEVPGAGVVKEALGYLHGNCGHCHNDQNFLATKLRMRLRLLVGVATPEETPAYRTAIGGKAAHFVDGTTLLVVPGQPELSQLFVRMGLRNLEAMPPICSKVVDSAGMQTIGDWIRGLP